MSHKLFSIAPGSIISFIPERFRDKLPGLLTMVGVSLMVALPTWVTAREFLGSSASMADHLAVALLVLAFTTSVGLVVWMWRSLLSRTLRDTPRSWEDWK